MCNWRQGSALLLLLLYKEYQGAAEGGRGKKGFFSRAFSESVELIPSFQTSKLQYSEEQISVF